jgi:ABC-2 type transport system permease protein
MFMTDRRATGSSACFLVAEFDAVFRRRRNLVLLALVALLPVVIAVALRRSPGMTIDAGRPGIRLDHGAASGVHVALAGLLGAMPFLLPLTVALVAGDAIAGEAQAGTLRYLLTVPVRRTRLLVTKYVALVGWCAVVAASVTAAGAAAGFLLFPSRRVEVLSGRAVSWDEGVARLLLAAGYVTVMLAALAAIGLFASTLTDAPLAAVAATLSVAVAGQIVETMPGLQAIRPWLPTHYWPLFVDVLSDGPATPRLEHGLLAQAGFAALFLALGWAQFTGRDVTA